MSARVTTYEGASAQTEAVRQAVQGLAEQLRAVPGFEKGYFLIDRASSRGISITLWESEQAMQSSASAVGPLRTQLSQALGAGGQPSIATYEVAGEI